MTELLCVVVKLMDWDKYDEQIKIRPNSNHFQPWKYTGWFWDRHSLSAQPISQIVIVKIKRRQIYVVLNSWRKIGISIKKKMLAKELANFIHFKEDISLFSKYWYDQDEPFLSKGNFSKALKNFHYKMRTILKLMCPIIKYSTRAFNQQDH